MMGRHRRRSLDLDLRLLQKTQTASFSPKALMKFRQALKPKTPG